MLTADELHEALRTRLDVRRIVSRRKAEHAWVRADPGPMTYSPEPCPMPPDPIGLTIVYGPSDEFAGTIRAAAPGPRRRLSWNFWLVDRPRPGYGRQIPYSVRPGKNCSSTICGLSGRPMCLCSKKAA